MQAAAFYRSDHCFALNQSQSVSFSERSLKAQWCLCGAIICENCHLVSWQVLTSPTERDRVWTIFSCAMATTLWPFISMILCPTRTPPRSAMPPRIKLQIWGYPKRVKYVRWYLTPTILGKSHPSILSPDLGSNYPNTHNAVLNAEAELKLQVGPLDEDGGDRRAAHNTQLYLHLVLQTLERAH